MMLFDNSFNKHSSVLLMIIYCCDHCLDLLQVYGLNTLIVYKSSLELKLVNQAQFISPFTCHRIIHAIR